MAADAGFTVFRYNVTESGNRVFKAGTAEGGGGVIVAVYDSNGEERHVNIGELGVDRSFEQWMEPGVWYVAMGRLRGSEETAPAFLGIQ